MNRIRIGLLCTVTLIAPSLMHAQMGTLPNTPNQPNNNQPPQPGQMPNGMPGGGMAGSMTGTGPGSGDDQDLRDQMFVRNAAEGGVTEVQLGQLAAQKGGSDEVKSFGQKMVDDHTMMNENLRPVAESMDVRMPAKMNKQGQAEYDKLNGLSGNDFDKEYLTYMVKNHHDDLREFRMEYVASSNEALREVVEQGQRMIMQHAHMLGELARSKGVAAPVRGNHRPPQAQ